eukprot:3377383-Rhodomonas_salina.2
MVYATTSAHASEMVLAMDRRHQVASGLRACYAMSGTERPSQRYHPMHETHVRYHSTRSAMPAHSTMRVFATSLRACYAMSGTDLPYSARSSTAPRPARSTRSPIRLRACYAMPGTNIAYGRCFLRVASGRCAALSAYTPATHCLIASVNRLAVLVKVPRCAI